MTARFESCKVNPYGPENSHFRSFLYPWPKVNPISCTPQYKSMGKIRISDTVHWHTRHPTLRTVVRHELRYSRSNRSAGVSFHGFRTLRAGRGVCAMRVTSGTTPASSERKTLIPGMSVSANQREDLHAAITFVLASFVLKLLAKLPWPMLTCSTPVM